MARFGFAKAISSVSIHTDIGDSAGFYVRARDSHGADLRRPGFRTI